MAFLASIRSKEKNERQLQVPRLTYYVPLTTFMIIILIRFSFLENISFKSYLDESVESNSREHRKMLTEHSPEGTVIPTWKLWSL